eukprot:5464894-Alexandrium_andersonii.AAC.1
MDRSNASTSPCAPPSGGFQQQAAAHGHGCTSSIRPHTRALSALTALRAHASGHARPAAAEAGQPPGRHVE